MNGEFQDRKDIDKLFHDLYRVDGQTANVVKYADQSKFINGSGTPKNIDEILSTYYDSGEVDVKIQEAIIGDIDLSDYYTKEQINAILSSYATIGFANSQYALKTHTHSQYITREEISDLDINLTTLELVPYEDNQNGVMCFDRVQKTIDELDIDLKADTLSNGYLKIEVNLIEVTRSI